MNPIEVNKVNVNVVNSTFVNNSEQNSRINEIAAREYLTAHAWPTGLQEVLIKNLYKVPLRFFICDDSASMLKQDGHKIITDHDNHEKLVPCTRWSELANSIKFHAGLCRAAHAPAEYRMLNVSKPLLIGTPDDAIRYEKLVEVLNRSPNGETPLCHHIRAVSEIIKSLEPQLRANDQYVSIVIATDGEASDGNISEVMRPLQHLPVWVVVKLCTDEEKIVNYWNALDSQLEINMEVLDDLVSEAIELSQVNSWLNYGEPLHRLREFGMCALRELDLLDESALSLEQVRSICCLIFGGMINDYPNADVDWNMFLSYIIKKNKSQSMIWCPITRTKKFWIDTKKLSSVYHSQDANCSCVIS